jgi:SAM-dependent methyltransferase
VGWEVDGIEWDPIAADLARRRSGRPVWDGDFRKVELPLAQYDLVLLAHVFEHLDAPLMALQRIRELLKPGGRAVLYYPNPESLGAWLFRDSWYHWDAPRHLVLPPKQALVKAATWVGLVPIRFRTGSKGAVNYFAYSRAYRAGRPMDLSQPETNTWDYLVAALEHSLLWLGLPLGEEAVLVARKPLVGEMTPGQSAAPSDVKQSESMR